jgi:hypothetical protein
MIDRFHIDIGNKTIKPVAIALSGMGRRLKRDVGKI